MYKDKDKQREAVKEATRRYRSRKGITKVSPDKGITASSSVIPIRPEGMSESQWNYIKYRATTVEVVKEPVVCSENS